MSCKSFVCHICNVIKYDGVTYTPNLTYFNLLLFIELDKKRFIFGGVKRGRK